MSSRSNASHKLIGRAATLMFLPILLSSALCAAAGWTPPLTVSRAFTENSDIIAIYTSDGAAYTPNCSVNSWIFRGDTDARRNRAWATIMAAITTGQKIQFWYVDSCTTWNYHEATSVMLTTSQ